MFYQKHLEFSKNDQVWHTEVKVLLLFAQLERDGAEQWSEEKHFIMRSYFIFLPKCKLKMHNKEYTSNLIK